jgi:hypothetical protein
MTPDGVTVEPRIPNFCIHTQEYWPLLFYQHQSRFCYRSLPVSLRPCNLTYFDLPR